MNFKRGENPYAKLDIGTQRKEALMLHKHAYHYACNYFGSVCYIEDPKFNKQELYQLIENDYIRREFCIDKKIIIKEAVEEVMIYLNAETYHQEMIKDSIYTIKSVDLGNVNDKYYNSSPF